MKKFELISIDYPDYFRGYHLPTVNVPIYGIMTNAEVIEELKNELNCTFELFEDIWNDEYERLFNDYINELKNNPDKIFFDPDYLIDCEDNFDDDPLYLYFSFTDRKIINGIEFLS